VFADRGDEFVQRFLRERLARLVFAGLQAGDLERAILAGGFGTRIGLRPAEQDVQIARAQPATFSCGAS
jgi:hypothetical protein